MDHPELCRVAALALLAACGAAFSALVGTWRAWLTTKYWRVAWERETRSCTDEKRKLIEFYLRRCNAMQKSLLQSFMQEPVPTLDSLVERTEEEWSLRQSERLSRHRSRDWGDEHDETMELRTSELRDLTRR